MLVDSHCHLNFRKFRDLNTKENSNDFYNIDSVLKRAKASGVTHVLSAGTSIEDSREVLNVSRETFNKFDYPKVYSAVGIHPDHAQETLDTELLDNAIGKLRELALNDDVIGIGECGIDYRIDKSQRSGQLRMFEAQCELSKELDIPLEIHSRCAEEDTIEVLKNGRYRGTIHCFSGSKEFAEKALDLGFYISFSGIVTFKNAKEVQEVAEFVPRDRMLLETDSPFLAPTPYRGQVNEPAFVKNIAGFIANIRNTDFNEICRVTSENFFRLFTKVVAE